MITTFWWNVLASAIGQTVAFILYQGFVRSYLGIKGEKEVRIICDRFLKSWIKTKINLIHTYKHFSTLHLHKYRTEIDKKTVELIKKENDGT